jgi:hypothetical protein
MKRFYHVMSHCFKHPRNKVITFVIILHLLISRVKETDAKSGIPKPYTSVPNLTRSSCPSTESMEPLGASEVGIC